ncbi:MAG: hypothetical protein MJ172_05030 [Clostridia bacterium]|nr:hypothetical protein [Clostridia bacterium]
MSSATLSVSNESKTYAILSYVFGLWIIGLFKSKETSSYLNSHLRHGIYFSICDIFLWVPILGQALFIANLILRIIGVIYAMINRPFGINMPILTMLLDKVLRKMTTV